MGDKKLGKRADAQKWRAKAGDEDRECAGRTVLGEVWEEWEKNGEQQQNIEGVAEW